MASHLVELEKAGAVTVDLPAEQRRGRSARYTIDPYTLRHLLSVMGSYVFPATQTPGGRSASRRDQVG